LSLEGLYGGKTQRGRKSPLGIERKDCFALQKEKVYIGKERGEVSSPLATSHGKKGGGTRT